MCLSLYTSYALDMGAARPVQSESLRAVAPFPCSEKEPYPAMTPRSTTTDTATRLPLGHAAPPRVFQRSPRPDLRAELRRWYGVETDEQVRDIAERTLAVLDGRRAA